MKVPAAQSKTHGFTLIEMIIYIALFSIIFTGIFLSIYPIFTGAERLTKNIAIEGETAFILTKLNYTLTNTITDSNGVITTPAAGQTANELVLSYDGEEQFRFSPDTSGTFCSAPLLCQMLTLQEDGAAAQPLNAQRVNIDNFSVTHVAPHSDGTPRYLDISFTANGEPVGPIRYYLHF